MEEEYINEDLLYDVMYEPDLSPLNESYHDDEELKEEIKHTAVPSFKSCFANDKYLIDAHSSCKSHLKYEKMFWLEN